MSIESAIEGTPARNTVNQHQRARLHGRMIDVHVDKENPLKSYITVEAEAKNNLGRFSGTYNISLNSEMTPQQRFQASARAQEKGSGVCGGLINERMVRRKGKPVLLSNFQLTGDHVGTCRWVDFSRKEVHRRAALVHTAEVKSRANQGGPGYPRITHVTMMRHEAFDVDDAESVDRMKELADKNFAEATRPRNYTVPKDPTDPGGEQRQHLRSSMPRSAFAFVIIDDRSKEVIEYSDFLHRRRNFKESDMPEHFTPEDVKEFQGKYPSLPYNGESVQNALNQVKKYADTAYADSDVTPKVLCVEGVRYRTSKVAETTDIQSPRNVSQTPSNINEMSPVEMIHLANKTQYATSNGGSKGSRPIRNCAYVPDVTFNFADNKGDTYSKFIDCKTEYPSLDKPWIRQITYAQEPLVIPEALKEPVANSVLEKQAQQQAPAQAQQQAPAQAQQQAPDQAQQQAPAQAQQQAPDQAQQQAPAQAQQQAPDQAQQQAPAQAQQQAPDQAQQQAPNQAQQQAPDQAQQQAPDQAQQQAPDQAQQQAPDQAQQQAPDQAQQQAPDQAQQQAPNQAQQQAPDQAQQQAPDQAQQQAPDQAQQQAPAPSVPDDDRFADSESLSSQDQRGQASVAPQEAEPENPDADIFHGPDTYTFGL